MATADHSVLEEVRMRPRQAIIAAAGAGLLVAAAGSQLAGSRSQVGELTVQLILIHKRFPLDLIGAVLQGAGLVALVWTLSFLFGAARRRRPESAPATRIAAVAGGVVSAVGGVVYAAVLAVKANQFVSQGAQTYPQANALTKGAALPVLQTLDIAAEFALAIGLILIALNAMRVGLLPKFIGYCGIAVGAAGMLLIGSAPAVALQIFWLGAIAYLLAGRWPSGDPPAWRTGQAVAWPTAAELRERRTGAAPARGRAGRRAAPAPAAEPVDAQPEASVRTRTNTPKRKRKRRR